MGQHELAHEKKLTTLTYRRTTDACSEGDVNVLKWRRCELLFLVSRACFMASPEEPHCKSDSESGGMACMCKTDLCNTGTVQSHLSVVHEMIVSCVTVTAVVGRIFHY